MESADTNVISNILPWLEAAYYIAAILLVPIAILGLTQIRLARQQLKSTKQIFKLQSIRSSYETAAKECNRFTESYSPLTQDFTNFLEERKIQFFTLSTIENTDDGMKIDYSNIDPDEIDTIHFKASLILNMANLLEGFALYILSGVADDDIAFYTLGKPFTKEAENLAKILPFLGAEQEDCSAIWVLYFRWKNRLEHQQLQLQKEAIEKKIKSTSVVRYNSIGTTDL